MEAPRSWLVYDESGEWCNSEERADFPLMIFVVVFAKHDMEGNGPMEKRVKIESRGHVT